MKNLFEPISSSISRFFKSRHKIKAESKSQRRPSPTPRDSGYSETTRLLDSQNIITSSAHSTPESCLSGPAFATQKDFSRIFTPPPPALLDDRFDGPVVGRSRGSRFPTPPPHHSPAAIPRPDGPRASPSCHSSSKPDHLYRASSPALYNSDYGSTRTSISSFNLETPSQDQIWAKQRSASSSLRTSSLERTARAGRQPRSTMENVTEGVAIGTGKLES